MAPTANTKPAIASVDDREERSTEPERITDIAPDGRCGQVVSGLDAGCSLREKEHLDWTFNH